MGCTGEVPVSGDGSEYRGAALLLLLPAYGAARLRRYVSQRYSLDRDDTRLFSPAATMSGVAVGAALAWATVRVIHLSDQQLRVSGSTFVIALATTTWLLSRDEAPSSVSEWRREFSAPWRRTTWVLVGALVLIVVYVSVALLTEP